MHHIFFSCHGQTKTSEDFLGIQIASDLHIEFYGELGEIPKDIIVPSAPVLALVGDISLVFTDLLRDFLWQQTDRFEEVLFVAGNHEFYNVRGDTKTIEEQWQWLEEVCSKRKNLHLLEKKSIEIKGVKILGTALWSHIPKDVQPRAASSLNDYHICFTNVSTVIATQETRKLHPFDTSQWHSQNVDWLNQEICQAGANNQPLVVLTHHTPMIQGTSAPEYEGSELNACFSTDLTNLLRPPVKAWACGHTHWNFDK